MANLLLVDDDPLFLRLGRATLVQAGHHVDAATNTPGALDHLRRKRYDLLLLDVHLGAESGMEVVRQLPPLNELTPVVVLTAMPTVETAVEAVNHSVAEYALKPGVNLPLLVQQSLHKAEARLLLQRSEAALRQWTELADAMAAEVQRLRQALAALGPTGMVAPMPVDTSTLSDRERKILQLLVEQGLSNKELADHLELSEHTVKNHLKAIFRKLGVHSRAELLSRSRKGQR